MAELGEEVKTKAPLMAKQKRESEFLKQKTEHYQKLVSTMTVCNLEQNFKLCFNIFNFLNFRKN